MLTPGDRLGPYEVLGVLGAGGMGEVYRARDTRLERDVAVKVLPDALATDAEALARFEREAKAVAALSHPNILAIHDFGNADGVAYAVMELLEGETLRERLARGALPVRKAVELGAHIANGLAAAHERGIVHRDLKPENLFLTTDGRVKILDFGLARVVPRVPGGDAKTLSSAPEGGTSPGALLGTVGYLAPEQVRGLPADRRSDIFSFGCVLFESLSGSRAFRRESAVETMTAILKDDPPDLPLAERRIPQALDRVVRRCLEKLPDQRFQSARDVAFFLEAVTDVAPPPAAPAEREVPSIAVLPFADMSAAKDQDYFCEGIAEELIHALTRLPNLRVASRTASFVFKGNATELASIAQQLRVSTILEGSVRKSGDRLRVSVQLIEAAEGFHLWSERYDRDASDVFAIQDDITEKVILALRLVLGEKERQALSRTHTGRVEAYDFYLRGRKLYYMGGRRNQGGAIEQFERAVALDPDYALAFAGIADASSMLFMHHGGREEDLARAEEASEKALELAPHLAECHAARGFAASLGRRPGEAERELRTALALDPALFEAKYVFARLRVTQGRLEDAARLFEEALGIRPEDHVVPLLLSGIYKGFGREGEARAMAARGVANAERYAAANPLDPRPLYLAAGGLVTLGRREEGLALAARAYEMGPEDDAILYNVACTYAGAGEHDRAMECLESAVRHGFSSREWLEHDADLDPIRGTDRFKAILELIASKP
jgi:serine/threonine protein kinase